MSEIRSLFDIYNQTETGLSRSLAFLIQKDYRILKKLLYAENKNNDNNNFVFTNEDKKSLEVKFEDAFNDSRFDITCETNNYYILIETKVGKSIVFDKQFKKYIEHLNSIKNKTYKVFFLLTEFENQKQYFSKYPKIKVVYINWINVYSITQKLKMEIKLNLSHEFDEYITRSQSMNFYDIEIWAVVVKDKELDHFNNDSIYLNGHYHKPLFIARRHWDKKKHKVVVDEIHQVTKIIKKNSKEAQKEAQKMKIKVTNIYKFGPAIKLTKPINKEFKGMRSSFVELKFSDL
jgi:hypothetical protein